MLLQPSLRKSCRQGIVLPLVAVCLMAVFAMLALAIDLGMLVIARTQAQNAADIAALIGARMLNGDGQAKLPKTVGAFNATVAANAARTAATDNQILGTPLVSANVTQTQVGTYIYNPVLDRFETDFTKSTPGPDESWGAMRVSISTTQPTYFARVWGILPINIAVSATAVHRPRDIALILDFSGSMKFSSVFCYGVTHTVTGPNLNTSFNNCYSLNGDTIYPRFGPWGIHPVSTATTEPSNVLSRNPFQRVSPLILSNGETHALNNYTQPTENSPFEIATAFLTTGGLPAFSKASDALVSDNLTGAALAELGDRFPLDNNGTNYSVAGVAKYAATVRELLGLSIQPADHARHSWEDIGYGPNFRGWTRGPGYYGKTFYMWPPDPRDPVGGVRVNVSDTTLTNITIPGDWRKRYFLMPTATSVVGSGSNAITQSNWSARWVTDNNLLWQGTPNSSITFATSANNQTLVPHGCWHNHAIDTSSNPARVIVNYDAVIKWLKTPPLVLPIGPLYSGRVRYYSQMPDEINRYVNQRTGALDSTALNAVSDPELRRDIRFWKEYIDFVLGMNRYRTNRILYGANFSNTGYTGLHYGFTSSTPPRISPRPNPSSGPRPYMHYEDNPVHPRLQFWFGPLTMMGFIAGDHDDFWWNWTSGTSYESQTWQLKAGVQAAIKDIQNNHPNDMASLIYFSSIAQYGVARVRMSNTLYPRMINALWYPFSTLTDNVDPVTGEGILTGWVRPYGNNFGSNPFVNGTSGRNPGDEGAYSGNIPLAAGATNPEHALKVAYNQFSTATNISDNTAGGSSDPANPGKFRFYGRRGASKVVILETDGVPNNVHNASSLSTSTTQPYKRFYTNVIGSSTGIGNFNVTSAPSKTRIYQHSPMWRAIAAVRQLCAMDYEVNPADGVTPQPGSGRYARTDPDFTQDAQYQNVTAPGYSTSRMPVRVHTLAFGQLFEPATTATTAGTYQRLAGLWFLLECEKKSGLHPASADPSSFDPTKIIIGNYNDRINKIRDSLERIMQGGISVSLVE